MARARRWLVQFELIERAVLLLVTVALIVFAAIDASTHEPARAIAATLASVISGGALVVKSRPGRTDR